MQQTKQQGTYPPQCYRVERQSRQHARKRLSLLLLGIVFLGWGGISSDALPALAAIIIPFLLLFALEAVSQLREPLLVRISPSFASQVTGAGFYAGYAIARNANGLDDLARLFGSKPLSAFGYADEGQTTLYAAGEVQDSLTTLITALQDNPFLLGSTETPAVLADLERLHTRIQTAEREGVPVRFILRYGSGLLDPATNHSYWC